MRKLLLSTESPWEFETYGSIRSQFFREKVYRENDTHPRCFQYYIEPKYGYAISRGRWLPKNKELFAAHNLNVDFDNLGIMGEAEYLAYLEHYNGADRKNQAKQHHTTLQKLLLPFAHPGEFVQILRNLFKKYRLKWKFYFPFLP